MAYPDIRSPERQDARPTIRPVGGGENPLNQIIKSLKQTRAGSQQTPFGSLIPKVPSFNLGEQLQSAYAQPSEPAMSESADSLPLVLKALRSNTPAPTAPTTTALPATYGIGRNTDAQAVIDTANRLQMNPQMLAAVLHYESGFNPSDVGPSGKGYSVRGLIGFDPENVRKYGDPAPTIPAQMSQVEQYLLDRGWKPGTHDPNDLARLYSIVNAGSLDKNGDPRLNAKDINGTISDHIQRIQSGSYDPAYKYLYGNPPSPPPRQQDLLPNSGAFLNPGSQMNDASSPDYG
jgi:hypothetical protein